MIYSTSQDILLLIIAICVLWLTIVSAWLLYHLISVARYINQTVKNLKEKVQSAEGVMTFFKNKITTNTTYLTLIATAIAKLITIMSSQTKNSRKSKR